jgi:hypothetical protein
MRFGYGQWPAPPMAPAWGAPAPGPMAREQELQVLKDHAEALKSQLEQISARIGELKEET